MASSTLTPYDSMMLDDLTVDRVERIQGMDSPQKTISSLGGNVDLRE